MHIQIHTHTLCPLGIQQPALTYNLRACSCDLRCSSPKEYFSVSLVLYPHNKAQLHLSVPGRLADGVTVIVVDKHYFALQRGAV